MAGARADVLRWHRALAQVTGAMAVRAAGRGLSRAEMERWADAVLIVGRELRIAARLQLAEPEAPDPVTNGRQDRFVVDRRRKR